MQVIFFLIHVLLLKLIDYVVLTTDKIKNNLNTCNSLRKNND